MEGGDIVELPIRLSKDSKTPIYHQIEEQIKALIASGHLSAGAILPSIRSLSKDLEISVITTRRAYQNLEYQGFIKTSQGKGTYVAFLDEVKKEEVTVSTVYQAIEKGVNIALQHDYSLEQIEEVFQNVLHSLKQQGE